MRDIIINDKTININEQEIEYISKNFDQLIRSNFNDLISTLGTYVPLRQVINNEINEPSTLEQQPQQLQQDDQQQLQLQLQQLQQQQQLQLQLQVVQLQQINQLQLQIKHLQQQQQQQKSQDQQVQQLEQLDQQIDQQVDQQLNKQTDQQLKQQVNQQLDKQLDQRLLQPQIQSTSTTILVIQTEKLSNPRTETNAIEAGPLIQHIENQSNNPKSEFCNQIDQTIEQLLKLKNDAQNPDS